MTGKFAQKYHLPLLYVEDTNEHIFVMRSLAVKMSFPLDVAKTIEKAFARIEKNAYGLIILDRVLPDGDGIEVLSYIREMHLPVRVLMLSQKGAVTDRINGLEKGADDYLPKPFSEKELELRIRALLRRSVGTTDHVRHIGRASFLSDSNTVQYDAKSVRFTPKEFRLLHLLATHPQQFCSRETILTSLWSLEERPENSAVDVLIQRIRKKIRSLPMKIVTKYNSGYGIEYTETI